MKKKFLAFRRTMLFILATGCAPPAAATVTVPPASSGPAAEAGTTAPTADAGWRGLLVLAPAGWSAKEDAREPDHLEETFLATSGTCRATLDRWAGLPPDPGGPMMVASKRRVVVDGRQLDLVKTSMFQGASAVVDVLFVSDGRAYARAAFRDCNQEQVDLALSTAHVGPAVRDQPH